MPAALKHARIVVALDLCSSSQIMEDLLLSEKFDRYETFLTCVKRWLMNWTTSHPSGNGRFDLYKFTGDGWILLFPAATDGMALIVDCYKALVSARLFNERLAKSSTRYKVEPTTCSLRNILSGSGFACRKIDFTADSAGQAIAWPTHETSGWTCARSNWEGPP